MTELEVRAHRLRHETLPRYRPRLDPYEYILLTCDADVTITAAEIGNAKTVDRLVDRLTKRLDKLDSEAMAA